jgi:ribulose 1,5-bisphosphate carboxylase large subunit-like protein
MRRLLFAAGGGAAGAPPGSAGASQLALSAALEAILVKKVALHTRCMLTYADVC